MAETLMEALAEIDRLRGLVKAAYHEGAMFESRGDLCWDDSDAKAAIWSTTPAVGGGALVEALEKAGVADAGWYNVETTADTLLRISARFASPEVKREVLRTLLEERLEALTWDDLHRWRAALDEALYGELSNEATARKAIRDFLAPSPGATPAPPLEGTNDER